MDLHKNPVGGLVQDRGVGRRLGNQDEEQLQHQQTVMLSHGVGRRRRRSWDPICKRGDLTGGLAQEGSGKLKTKTRAADDVKPGGGCPEAQKVRILGYSV